MIKNLRYNQTRKHLFFALILLILYFSLKMFAIITREEASKIDKEVKNIQSQIAGVNQKIQDVQRIIQETREMHERYTERASREQSLIIDSNILNEEMNQLVDLLNRYYNSDIFRLNLDSVNQSENYINLAEVIISFSFSHNANSEPEVAKLLEDTVMESVFGDILNNFNKIVAFEKSISKAELSSNSLRLFFVKE